MKKNRTMRVATLLLALTLITSCFVGGTFAKYTSNVTATDTARVAKWEFEVGEDNNIAPVATNDFEFNLWDHTDSNVDYDANGDKVIAPGTSGEFAIVLTNKSEVNATYAIDYTVDNMGVPIEYSIDGTTWTEDLADVTETAIAMNNGTATINIQWRWTFVGSDSENYNEEQTDVTDTALGEHGNAAPFVTAKVTATQVD